MVATLALALMAGAGSASGATGATTIATDEAVVRVTISGHNVFDPGDRAHVRVRVKDDAYLVVLQAAPDGQVSVLFPRYPSDDDFVRGGSDFEVQGPGGRESFVVAEVGGSGMVYAAVSKEPFHFDALVENGYWDRRAFPDTATRNPEAVLTDVVQRMATTGGRFDYDLANYTVTRPYDRSQPTYSSDENGSPAPSTTVYMYDEPGWYPWGSPWYYPPVAYGWGWGYPVYSPWFYGYGPGFYGGPVISVGFGFGGCFSCGYFPGYYPGFYGGRPYFRPGWRAPIGPLRPPVIAYRPRGFYTNTMGAPSRASLFANARLGTGALGAAPWRAQARGGPSVRGGAVFANARVGTAAGGAVAWRARAATPTVFPQVRSVGGVSPVTSGRVVYRGATTEAGQPVQPARATGIRSATVPTPMRGMSASTPVPTRVVGVPTGGHRVTGSIAGGGNWSPAPQPQVRYGAQPQAHVQAQPEYRVRGGGGGGGAVAHASSGGGHGGGGGGGGHSGGGGGGGHHR